MTNIDQERNLRPGEARAPGPSIQDLIKRVGDGKWPLTEESYVYIGSEDLPKERYSSQAFFDAEMQKLWTKVWQVACRVEEIPNVGDSVVYDIGDYSIAVVRVTEIEIRGYYNSCLHRGTALFDGDCTVDEIRCPFHGFCWKLDGSIKEVPCGWDFPHVWGDDLKLPEVLIDTWEGFVFINMDRDAQPLLDYLGGLVPQLSSFSYPWGKRYKAAHMAKVIPCNWKAGLEAFIESYHVRMAHGIGGIDDSNAQYDTYPDEPHWSRALFNVSVGANPSTDAALSISPVDVTPPITGQRIDEIHALEAENRRRWTEKSTGDDPWGVWDTVTDPEQRRMIRAAVKGGREAYAEMTGDDLSDVTDAEIATIVEYLIFPNMLVWLGPIGRSSGDICYRFRPNGNDPNSSIMEIMLLYPFGALGHPPAAAVTWLEPDEPASTYRLLGPLGPILDQDEANFPRIQKGLRAGGKPGVTLANYNEGRIRHMHQTIDWYLNA